MRNPLLFLMLLLGPIVFGQKSEMDSLYAELKNHPQEDSLHVRILLSLCWHEAYLNPEKQKEMAEEAIKISKQINYRSGEAAGIRSIGIYYLNKGNYDQASERLYQALRIFENGKDLKGIGNCYSTLGSIHRQRDDFEKSKEFYGKAIEMYQKTNNEKDMAGTYNSLGVLHLSARKFDEALAYINKSLDIRKKINDRYGISQSYSNMAIIYTNQNKHNEALDCFEKNLPIVEEMNDKQLLAVTLDGMGHLYTLTGDYKKAEASLLRALALAKELGFKRTIEVAYSKLTFLEETRGRHKEALAYSHEAYHYLDSAYSEESTAQIAEAETRYETEKKNQTIELLERDKRIQKLWTTVATVSFMLLAISFFIFYFFQRYRENKNRKILNLQIDYLTSQYQELATKSKQEALTINNESAESYDQALLKKAIAVVEANIADPLFGIEKLAEGMGMSRATLQRKVKAITRFPPSELIRNIRLRKAAVLLRGKSDSVSQISFLVGFDDPSYFAKCFKKQFGVPPSEYFQAEAQVASVASV
jgi:AraC-like DNA-binding protein/tetratricopeptide (TPR) repeat protein